MRKTTIVTIRNSDWENGKYFFSSDHCQNHGLGSDWVPTTFYLPMQVVPREGLEDGIIDTKEKLKLVFHENDTEILNPNQDFQV